MSTDLLELAALLATIICTMLVVVLIVNFALPPIEYFLHGWQQYWSVTPQ